MYYEPMDRYQEYIDSLAYPDENEERLSGNSCPCCNYPLVYEGDIEVCYNCGWYDEDKWADESCI